MCSTPKAPPPPAPLAAAPRLPNEVNRGLSKKPNGQQQSIITSARGIYQPLGGKDLLGQ